MASPGAKDLVVRQAIAMSIDRQAIVDDLLLGLSEPANTLWDALAASGDRGAAMIAMAEGSAAIVRRLRDEGRIDGILGMGGSGSSSIISAAMRRLPIGFPKLLVSTMGAGDVSAFVGTSDIAMMYSVVDIAGINAVSSSILGNAAAAVSAMAVAYEARVPPVDTRPLVGATMYGTTTQCVDVARDTLDELGYEIDEAEVIYWGRCPECRATTRDSPGD